MFKSVPEVGPCRIPLPRESHPWEWGWCVDDDGVRGVRPYLFHQPVTGEAQPSPGDSQRSENEFDELAGLVRTWLSLAG